MPITGAQFDAYRIPFAIPWRSHAGTLDIREGWLIRLTDDQGATGYGDAAPLPEIGTETLPAAEQRLKALRPDLIGREPEQILATLADISDTPASRFGLETALLDLQSKQRALPLYQRLAPQTAKPTIETNASIGRLDSEAVARAVAANASGHTTLKLKLGLYPMTDELARLQRLCDQLPANCSLRLDANRAWHTDEAAHLITELKGHPIESLEEPLQNADPETLRQLQTLADFDLALDESLGSFLQHHALTTLPVHRIIIKPSLMGGLITSLDLIQQAYQRGIRSIITSSLESSAGIWPLLHLAAAADQLTEPAVHGLATASLFRSDVGVPPVITHGQIRLDDRPGSGFILSR